MKRGWPVLLLVFALLLGGPGCKNRRVKRTYSEDEIQTIAELLNGVAEINKRENNDSGNKE